MFEKFSLTDELTEEEKKILIEMIEEDQACVDKVLDPAYEQWVFDYIEKNGFVDDEIVVYANDDNEVGEKANLLSYYVTEVLIKRRGYEWVDQKTIDFPTYIIEFELNGKAMVAEQMFGQGASTTIYDKEGSIYDKEVLDYADSLS